MSISVFVSEDAYKYTYTTLCGVKFDVPKWILFSPRYNGGVIDNEHVRRYIDEALEKEM